MEVFRIAELKTEKRGTFVEVPAVPKTVITVLQQPQGERASPPPLEMRQIGNYVAFHGNDIGGYVMTPLAPSISAKREVHDCFFEIGAGYFQGKDGYYNGVEQDTLKRMTDFVMEIPFLEKRHHIDGSDETFYCVKLLDEDGEEHVLFIGEDEWGELASIIDKRLPMCQIFYDAVPQAGFKFKRLAGLVLKRASPEVHSVQTYWGWGERRQDGSRIFYHGGRADCTSPKKLLPIIAEIAERRKWLKAAWAITDVGPHSVTFPTISYSLAAYMDAPFTDAGFPLNFSLMEIGDSGLLKSAYSKVIFAPCVFPVDKRIHNIRGTEAAMNLLHQETYDDTLVIDDFNWEGTPADVQKKMRLLRASIRDFSDKSSREKFGGDGKIVKYAIRGGCVITGENRMVGQIRSAELRYLAVHFPCPLDGEKLRAFQLDSRLWRFFVSELIRFVETNYGEIVQMVEARVPVMRNQAGLKALRLADAYIYLVLTAELIARFLLENDVLSQDEGVVWLREASQLFFALVREQADGANRRDPYVRYVEEIFNLIGTGKLRIASSLETYVASIDRFCGYADGELLMLKKDDIYALVSAAFASRNEYLPVSPDDVSRHLKEHGFTKCDASSCLKKSSSKIPGRPRMLALIKEKCENLLEGISNGRSEPKL